MNNYSSKLRRSALLPMTVSVIFITLWYSTCVFSQKTNIVLNKSYNTNPNPQEKSLLHLENPAFDDSTNGYKIKLQGGIIRSTEFVYGNNKPKDLYDFMGISFSPEFDSVMSKNPKAFEKAQDVIGYNTIGLIASLATLGASIKTTIDILNSNGLGVDDETFITSILLMGVPLLVSLVTGILSENVLDDAVDIFNESEDNNLNNIEPTESSLQNRIPDMRQNNVSYFSFGIHQNHNRYDGSKIVYLGLRYNF